MHFSWRIAEGDLRQPEGPCHRSYTAPATSDTKNFPLLSPTPPPMQPFGEPSCEDELRALTAEEYQRSFFDATWFNREALSRDAYLIVGRRGSGKSSLSRYFTFQDEIPSLTGIVGEETEELFRQVIGKAASLSTGSRSLQIPSLMRIWEIIVWTIVFNRCEVRHSDIGAACVFLQGPTAPKSLPALIRQVLKKILRKLIGSTDPESDATIDIDNFLTHAIVSSAKAATLKTTTAEPVLVAIDTLEHYDVRDSDIMLATAALVQCAANMNRDYASRGVHIKVFISAEVFPHLRESEVSNPSKYIRNPVYMTWRPGDLLRLLCWKLQKSMEREGLSPSSDDTTDWSRSREVMAKHWVPSFGDSITNGNDIREDTFAYVVRHTQMRPRQLIILCNRIAQHASEEGTYPIFSADAVRRATRQAEREMAAEVINSYSKVYPAIGPIVDCLKGEPAVLRGNALDKIGRRSAAQWESRYSPYEFRKILAEIGVVGRVRSTSNASVDGRLVSYVSADYEYFSQDRLALHEDDECAIHPMFYGRLGTECKSRVVLPFPDHPTYEDLLERYRVR